MKNLILLTKNFYLVQKIINSISNVFPDVKLYKIIHTKSDILQTLTYDYKNIDLIILDCKLDANFILNFIDNLNCYKYCKSIILITNKTIILDKYNHYIYTYLNSITGDILIDTISKYFLDTKNTNSEKIVKDRITRELKKLKFNVNHVGSKYLVEVIYEIYKNKYIQFNLKGNIFPVISDKYKTSANTIKGNITQASNYMIKHCNKKFIKEYFGYLSYYKPTVKQIIETILDKI